MLPTAGWKACDKQSKALELFAQMMLENTVNEVTAMCLQCTSVPVFFSAGGHLLDSVSHTLQFPHQ